MMNNRKRRPTHSGEILREDVLPAAGLTQDKLARLLGVSRRTISENTTRASACHHRHGASACSRFRYFAGDVAGITARR